MHARSRQVLALMVVLLVAASSFAGMPQSDSSAGERPPFGPVIISPWMGSWHEFQRPVVRAGNFDLVKVHLAPGFGFEPHHVEDLIHDGARVVMFKTEDCHSDAITTYHHFVGRGFLDVVQAWPEIDFVIQVGNEPERCPIPMNQYVDGLFEIITQVKPVIDQPNLQWVAGLPMVPATAKQLLNDGWVQERYDGVGTNMLGHFSLTGEYHGWHEIVDFVLEEIETDLWLTEIGINDPQTSKTLKARRILEYVEQLPADRIGGIAIFTLAQGSSWPQYEITESMIPVFADREGCRFFVATERWLCGPFKDYWEEYGGLAIFGYPINDEAMGGNGATVQFFERSRFEWHPGVWPEKHDVLLGHLGLEMIRDRRYEEAFQPVESSPAPGDECVYFAATRQHLCDEFLEYWNTFGGLPIFGYPVSQELIERGFRVQYFERARFEHQPGVWSERFDVLQGLLGVQALSGSPPMPEPEPDPPPVDDDLEEGDQDDSEPQDPDSD